LKDLEAEAASVAAGFTSRTEVIQRLGRDPDEVDAERLADAERERRLGLATPARAEGKATNQATVQEADEDLADA
jgi:capsid protein